MNPEDILSILAPPTGLVDYIERLFSVRTAKGEQVPADWQRWLTRWQSIRSDSASDIDYITPAEWDSLKEKVF